MSRLLQDRRLWLGLGILALVLALRASGLADHLSLATLAAHREALSGFVADHLAAAALAHPLVHVAAVAFSFPGAALRTALTVLGAALGATAVFLFARRLFGARLDVASLLSGAIIAALAGLALLSPAAIPLKSRFARA